MNTGSNGSKVTQLLPQRAFKRFLRWLLFLGQTAQHGAAVGRQVFQVDHLRALFVQYLQQAALAAARGTAQHVDEVEALGQGGQLGVHMAPVILVAALELRDGPADTRQDVRHGAAAVAAAPAVDEGLPVVRVAQKTLFDMPCDIFRHQRRAQLLRFEGARLFI